MIKKIPLVNEAEFKVLNTALYFMHLTELKTFCAKLGLPIKGMKAELVVRIITYLKTGKELIYINIGLLEILRK